MQSGTVERDSCSEWRDYVRLSISSPSPLIDLEPSFGSTRGGFSGASLLDQGRSERADTATRDLDRRGLSVADRLSTSANNGYGYVSRTGDHESVYRTVVIHRVCAGIRARIMAVCTL